MRIMADTSSMLSPALGAEEGIRVVPVSICVDGETFRDFVDISSEALMERIACGAIPTTSQPAVGDMLEAYEESEEETDGEENEDIDQEDTQVSEKDAKNLIRKTDKQRKYYYNRLLL